jgi:hypothetical protein
MNGPLRRPVPAYLAFSEIFRGDHSAPVGHILAVFPRHCVEFPPGGKAPAKYRGRPGSAHRVADASVLVSIDLGITFFIVVWPLDCHQVCEALGRLRCRRQLNHRYFAASDKSDRIYA